MITREFLHKRFTPTTLTVLKETALNVSETLVESTTQF